MARFYSNENFPLLTVVKLRELGHEVVTALEAGNANQRIADEAVLACDFQSSLLFSISASSQKNVARTARWSVATAVTALQRVQSGAAGGTACLRHIGESCSSSVSVMTKQRMLAAHQ
jgi:hypothetical protein